MSRESWEGDEEVGVVGRWEGQDVAMALLSMRGIRARTLGDSSR